MALLVHLRRVQGNGPGGTGKGVIEVDENARVAILAARLVGLPITAPEAARSFVGRSLLAGRAPAEDLLEELTETPGIETGFATAELEAGVPIGRRRKALARLAACNGDAGL